MKNAGESFFLPFQNIFHLSFGCTKIFSIKLPFCPILRHRNGNSISFLASQFTTTQPTRFWQKIITFLLYGSCDYFQRLESFMFFNRFVHRSDDIIFWIVQPLLLFPISIIATNCFHRSFSFDASIISPSYTCERYFTGRMISSFRQ